MGGILKGRKYTGKTADIITEKKSVDSDDVTTRIMWLDGLDEGKNKGGKVDSYTRYIYIHGTPEEGLLGTPASHGCIRMYNKQVKDLYDQASIGLHVLILDSLPPKSDKE